MTSGRARKEDKEVGKEDKEDTAKWKEDTWILLQGEV